MLMKRALEWLDGSNAKTKAIVVAEGNERVLDFYKRFGFYKRRIMLEQVGEAPCKDE
jgi:ribosomal protein S18 acetylase RimI-like enzyme